MDISGSRWKEAMNLTNMVTTNENLRLIQYKLMTRTYYTRDRLKKIDSKTSDLCIKCKSQPDSLLHAFWECPKVRNEWRKIEEWMSDICKRKMDFPPKTCIFQHTENVRYPMGWQIIFSSLIFKKLILKNWKNENAPSVESWKNSMKYYLNLERSLSVDSNKEGQFSVVWSAIYEAL